MAEKFLNYSGLTYLVGKIKDMIPDIKSIDVNTVSGVDLNGTRDIKSNKTTSISSSSTDLQYPSARAVYNAIPSSINGLTSGTAYGGNLSVKNQSSTACPTISASGSNNNNSVELSNTTLAHKVNGSTYTLTLPNKNGTLAVTSEIPDISTKLDNPGTGTNGQVLTYTANGAAWATPTSGTVNSITLNGTTYLPDSVGDVDLGTISGGSSKLNVQTLNPISTSGTSAGFYVNLGYHNIYYKANYTGNPTTIYLNYSTEEQEELVYEPGNEFFVLINNSDNNENSTTIILSGDTDGFVPSQNNITLDPGQAIEYGFLLINNGNVVVTHSEILNKNVAEEQEQEEE